jgi:radical SAM superfamily enzyme YgiQ (UPF0313 family)
MKTPIVLLLNPSSGIVKSRFNAGLLAIGSYLDVNGIRCDIFFGANDAMRRIGKEYPDDPILIGISMMTPQIVPALDLIAWCKNRFPHVPVLVGGYHSTLYPKQTLQHPGVDCVAVGPGEMTVLDIVRMLQTGGEFSPPHLDKIPGLAYVRPDGNLVVTGNRAFSTMADFPRMKYSLIRDYKPVVDRIETGKKVKMGHVLAGIGCVFKCSYCINSVLENRWQGRRAADIIDEVAFLVKKKGVNHIYFLDEFFFSNQQRIHEFVVGLEQARIPFTWFALNHVSSFRPDFLNAELLRRLRRCGCVTMLIGVESGSNRMLTCINKRINLDQVRTAVELMMCSGILPVLTFMLGMPGEEEEDMVLTFGLINELLAHRPRPYVAVSLFRPYPGSILAQKAYESGYQEPTSLADWGPEHFLWNERRLLHRMPWLSESQRLLALDILDVITVYLKFHDIRSPKIALFQAVRIALSLMYGSKLFYWLLQTIPYLDRSAESVFRPRLKKVYRNLIERYETIKGRNRHADSGQSSTMSHDILNQKESV